MIKMRLKRTLCVLFATFLPLEAAYAVIEAGASLTVNFPGMSSVHTDVWTTDGIPNSVSGTKLVSSNWKSDSTTVAIPATIVDLQIRKGGATYFVDDVDCTSGSCAVDGLVAEMTVSFDGLSSVHTDVRVPDGISGSADGESVTSSNWKTNSTTVKVFPQMYDLRVRKGAATLIVDNVDCTSGTCSVDGLVAEMTVHFEGLSSVHTDVLLPDGLDDVADGESVTSSNWKTNSTTIKVFPQVFDLRVRKGAATKVVDNVDCTSGTCAVDGLTTRLTVNFPGLSSVHTDVRLPDDKDNVANGSTVTSSNWKTNTTTIILFPGIYDLSLRQGSATHVIDNVNCTALSCTVDDLVAGMTVNFSGLTSVHTDVRLPDNSPGAADGSTVTSSNWKSNSTTINVFPQVYDLRVRKGAATQFVDNVDCTSGACSVNGLVAEMTVNFDGLSSVHTDVRLPDHEDNAANGENVTSSNWKANSTVIKVFPQVYDLRVRKGASTQFVDNVDCTSGACIVDGLVAEMTVNFDGLSSVHTDVRLPDNEDNAANGENVTTSNWKSNSTAIKVFPQVYDLRLRKGDAVQFVDNVDCTFGTCTVDGLTARMTVNFPGLSSVHTDVLVTDNEDNSANGGPVTSSNWRKDFTTITVFPQVYDLRIRKGATTLFVDNVDCRGRSCSVNDLTAGMIVRFPGLSSVHTDVRIPDGTEGTAEGGVVTQSNWQSQQTSITVLRQIYDVKVRHTIESVFDNIDCTSGACDALVTGNVQMTLIDGDTLISLPGKTVLAYEKIAGGTLAYHSKGTTDPEGKIHFTLPFDGGKIFTLKALNPFGTGKHYYSPFVSISGPINFVVTRDGENTLDLVPPVVSIGQPQDLANVTVNGFTVYGLATDNRSVDSVVVDVSSGGVTTTLAAQHTSNTNSWQVNVPANLLTAGVLVSINATASDPAHNSSSDSISVTPVIDTEGPVISFTSHQDQDAVPVTGFLLSGSVMDLTGISSLTATLVDPSLGTTLDGVDVDHSAASGAWTLAVRNGEISDNATVSITMEATDGDGNTSSASIDLVTVPVSHAGWQIVNRITFGATPALLQELATIGVDTYIDQQLAPGSIDDNAFDAMLGPDPTTLDELQAWTLKHMVFSRRQLQEVMTWFWDNHFNTDMNTTRTNADDVSVSNTVAYELSENQAFRNDALGNFASLLMASAKSPSMLIYLDSISNIAGDSNENYAREVKELHTLGVNGGYTESDVAAAAEVFTGWHLDTNTGLFSFDATRHNFDDQTILGQTFSGGLEQGEALLNFLARHPSTANYICTKLVTVFVDDTPPAPMVTRCGQTFLDTGEAPDQLAQVMRTILSNEFFDLSYFRSKIKSPVEFLTGALRNLQAATDATDLTGPMTAMGLRFYLNPVPTGYSEIGADWINSSLLIERIKWVNDLSRQPADGSGSGIEPTTFFPLFGFETSEGIVGFLLNLTVGDDFTDLARQQALDLLNGINGFDLTDADAEERLRQLIGVVLSYPSYQYQ